MNLFRDIYDIENQKKQLLKINTKQYQNDELIDYFRQSSIQEFQAFQMCLNIVDKLIKTLHGFLSYQANLQINQRFANLMQKKIRQCLIIYLTMLKYIHLYKEKQIIFISAIYLEKMLIVKCIEFRRRALCQNLTNAQEFNDFFTVIQSYQSIHNIWDKLRFDQDPLKSQMQTFNIKHQCEELMKKIFQNSQSWYRIQKQLFEVIIFTTFIPFQEYEKYNLLKRYYDIIKQQSSNKQMQTISSYAQYNAISKTFKLALQHNDFNTIINIFEFIHSKKSFIMNARLNYSIYYFFKKSNNSKKIKQCLSNMNTSSKIMVNQDVQHFNFEQRVLQIATQRKNEQRTSLKKLTSFSIQDIQSSQRYFIEKQGQYEFIRKNFSQPRQQKLSQQFLNEWNQAKLRSRQDKQIQTRLFDLRFILKQIFYSQEDLSELVKYLSKQYQIQVEKYETFLYKKIEFLKQRKKIKTQLWRFFGQQCLNQYQYWQKVKLSFIIRVRSKLLGELKNNLEIIQPHHVQLIKIEWQNFKNSIQKITSIEFQINKISKYPSMLTYFEYKAIVSRIIYLDQRFLKNKNDLRDVQIINNKNKAQYINSFIEYLKGAIIRYEKICKTANISINNKYEQFHTKKIMKNTSLIPTFRCQQSFSNMITDCYQGIIDEKDLDIEIRKYKNFKNQFSQGFNTQIQLKKCFIDIVQAQGIHMIFSLLQFRVRIVQCMISLGCKLILQGKIQQEMGCYFLTFVFYHICQFVKKYNCSSYLYIISGMLNSFQQKISHEVFKITTNKNEKQLCLNRDQDNQNKNDSMFDTKRELVKKLRLITIFQKDLIKFLIEQNKQQKIQHVSLILLACQRVKLQIILFLFKNKLIFQKDEKKIISPLQHDLKIIRKVQFVICGNVDRLEYLAKIFFKHTFYCYLVMINLTNKKFNLCKEKISEWLAFAMRKTQSITNKINNEGNFNHRHIQIKHFRSTRRILTSNQEKKQIKKPIFAIQQQYYHLIFQPIKQESFRKIPYYQKQILSSNNKRQDYSSFIFNKAMRFLGQKINRYLQISCPVNISK